MQKLINSHKLKLYLLLSYSIKLWFLINPGGSTSVNFCSGVLVPMSYNFESN